MPDTFEWKVAGLGVLAPALAAALLFLLAWRLATRFRYPGSPLISMMALSFGLLVAGLGMDFLSPISGVKSGLQWLLYDALYGIIPFVLVFRSRWLWPVAPTCFGLAAWGTIPIWPSLQAARSYWIAGLAMGMLLTWTALDFSARRLAPIWVALTMAATAATTAGVLMAAGLASFAVVVVSLAAVLGSLAVVSWFARAPALVRGVAPGYSLLLAGMLVLGYLNSFSAVPAAAYALPLLAAFVPLVHCFFPENLRLAWRIVIHFGILAVVLGSAAVLALLA